MLLIRGMGRISPPMELNLCERKPSLVSLIFYVNWSISGSWMPVALVLEILRFFLYEDIDILNLLVEGGDLWLSLMSM